MGDNITTPAEHWKAVYGAKTPSGVSWYKPHLEKSLSLILSTPAGQEARVIDVGGGASTLVDDLLHAGVRRVTVLDIAGQALAHSKARLGAKAARVSWVEGDITQAVLPERAYDVWHDRAVFHFLVNEEDRRRYVAQVRRAVNPGGHVILATFALSGPPKCSGLDVMRYSPDTLLAQLGRGFVLKHTISETHETPFKTTQDFIYCQFELVGKIEFGGQRTS
jgi:2-polyprenyl-3-methyl-5-hydroxy-6-metoxy-1,4-benzoquinol methylase